MRKVKTLNKDDRRRLLESGYSNNDIGEIEYAIPRTDYFLIIKDNIKAPISQKEAEDKLGHDDWLNAIAKSAFFIETTRTTKENEKILLHSKVYN